MRISLIKILVTLALLVHGDHQPLSAIAIHRTLFDLNEEAYVKASPTVLGSDVKLSLFYIRNICKLLRTTVI